jgi:hypothetical protein
MTVIFEPPRQLVLMRETNDCHNPVLANSTGCTYEQAAAAIGHVNLPGPAESPIFSNPWNLYRALIVLGFWKRNVTLTMLLSGECEPGKTVVLLHSPSNPNLAQHWVTWHGIDANKRHLLAWGDSQEFRRVSPDLLADYYRRGWPNCAFQVYKANFWRLMLARVQSWFN